MRRLCLASAVLCLLAAAAPAAALGPADVYLVVNKNVRASRELADYYCKKRGVSRDHVLAFALPAGEDISRADYEKALAAPLRERLKDRRDKVKVLLTFYGVPLRIGPQLPDAKERAALDKLHKQIEPLHKARQALDKEIKALEPQAKKDPKGQAAKDLAARRKEMADLGARLGPLEARRQHLSYAESTAALDSELALLWFPRYELRRWQLNLLYFQVPADARKGKPPVAMTARLDGPTPALVKRLIDDAVAVEAKGLSGKVYVDARGIGYNAKADGGHGYGGYDESMREMAKLLKGAGLDVTLDNKEALFKPNSCPDCALYCGWYSLARFVDSNRFVRGAVAWHLASSEAVTLRDPKTTQWCKNLLEKGAAATLGPVAEPYTIGFPKPAEFFGFLATGRYTLVESYWRSQLFASWMTVLVGDPLYNPYAKDPKLKVEQVKPSPKGVVIQFRKGGK